MTRSAQAEIVTRMIVDAKQFNRDMEKATKITENFGKTQRKSGKDTTAAFGGVGRSAGQASIQVQQLVGQIQGGVNPMVALSQQSADLGFVLGAPLLGAVVSIGAAMATFLAPNLFKSEKQTEQLTDKLKELKKEYVLTTNQLTALSRAEEKENEERRKRLAEVEKEIEKLEELEIAQKSLRANVDVAGLDDFVSSAAPKNIVNTTDRLKELRGEADNLNQELGELDRVKDYSDLIKELGQEVEIAKLAFNGSAEEADKLQFALSKDFNSFSELPEDAQRFYEELQQIRKEQERFIELQRQQVQSTGMLARLQNQLSKDDPLLQQNERRIEQIQELVLSEEQIRAEGFNNLLELQQSYINQSNELYDIQVSEREQSAYDAFTRQLDIAQAASDREAALEEEARLQKRRDVANDFVSNLNIAAEQNSKFAGIAKTAAIAQATIRTYESATASYAALAGIPVIGPALGTAAAAAAIAAGLANVAAIRSTPVAGARELGGSVSAGRTYLVGESGPELFTPGATGQITNNSNMKRALASSEQRPIQITLNAMGGGDQRYWNSQAKMITKALAREERR